MTLQLGPIADPDLNHKVSVATWRRALLVPWEIDAPDHGFLCRDGERIAPVLVPNLPVPFFGWRTRISAGPQVIGGNDSCYIVFREVTRKNLIELFLQRIVPLARYLLIHYQVVATLVKLRIIGPSSLFMHKSTTLEAA